MGILHAPAADGDRGPVQRGKRRTGPGNGPRPRGLGHPHVPGRHLETPHAPGLLRRCGHPRPQVAEEGEGGDRHEGLHRSREREACVRVPQARSRHALDRRPYDREPLPDAGDRRRPPGYGCPRSGEEPGQSGPGPVDRRPGTPEPRRRPETRRHPPRLLHDQQPALPQCAGLADRRRTPYPLPGAPHFRRSVPHGRRPEIPAGVIPARNGPGIRRPDDRVSLRSGGRPVRCQAAARPVGTADAHREPHHPREGLRGRGLPRGNRPAPFPDRLYRRRPPQGVRRPDGGEPEDRRL